MQVGESQISDDVALSLVVFAAHGPNRRESMLSMSFLTKFCTEIYIGINTNTGVSLCKWQVSEAVMMRENVLLKR